MSKNNKLVLGVFVSMVLLGLTFLFNRELDLIWDKRYFLAIAEVLCLGFLIALAIEEID